MADCKTILFPTDFSEASNRAFSYAAELANAFGAKVIVMHVEDAGGAADASRGFAELAAQGGMVETVRVKMKDRVPYQHIVELSKEKGCDLIVMATHGRSALSQFFRGESTAEEVARYSSTPVFIVKSGTDEPASTYTARLKEILFPTDLSEVSEQAFGVAAAFAKKFDARLFVLHVVDEDSARFYQQADLHDDGQLTERVEEFVKSHMATLAGADAVTSYHVVEGNAETEILRFAEANGVDLIALATHGQTGIREDLLGSTTDRVIRQARCPVLALRG